MALLREAVAAGAREERACEVVGIDVRTLQRWRRAPDDRRHGPKTKPRNALSARERDTVIEIMTSPEHCDLSPKQVVPKLADAGVYVASESTMYRLLRAAELQRHRGRARAPQKREIPSHLATGPHQVWCWDITYLPTTVRGQFVYLYMMIDVYSRKIMASEVHDHELADTAAEVMTRACATHGVDPAGLVLHSDNGSPMKGATMLATLQYLGVVASFSRPSVKNDNAYAERLFGTLKYRPGYPGRFATLEAARAWVTRFVAWYNGEHRHSAIRYVTPDERHDGRDIAILAERTRVYEKARRRAPARWSAEIRDWSPAGPVQVNNPRKKTAPEAPMNHD